MLGSPFFRKRTAERTAAQAWDYLSAAVAAAGDNARSAGSQLAEVAGKRGTRLAGETSSKVGSVADEAWQRANAAANALAGRRPALPWGLVIGAGLIGVALGWAAAATARAALARQAENDQLEMAEPSVIPTPTFDN